MKIYRYWASAVLTTQDGQGKNLLLKKWAGSNDSAEAARSAAERAVASVRDAVQGRTFPRTRNYRDQEYLYSTREHPEEFIRELSPKSAVTRNGHGCLILNTTEAFFADVDIPQPGFFARLGGATRQKREDEAIAQLNKFMETRPDAGARIYRTKAGLRYLFTHAPLAVSDETLGWLKELNSDRLYTKLCKEQDCFRARLSPKPFRLGIKERPVRFPRETPETRSAFDSWRSDYESRSNGFAVCKFVGIAGRDAIHSALSALVKDHDRATFSDSDMPLA